MRIAFIMLCHKNPAQINRLINRLSRFNESDIYIHVDQGHAEIRDEIAKQDNVFLIDPRKSYKIMWGNVSMVEATLQLIREVKAVGTQYDYLWLISGQDYPICSTLEIEKRLSSHPGLNYIDTIVAGDKKYNRYKKLYEIKYPFWINKNTFAVKVVKRLYMVMTGGLRHSFPWFIRKKPFNFEFAFGSQWWTLTQEAAFEILDYSDSHPEILQYFEQCIIPDECFFQTLFMNTVYRDKRSMNLTFINWGKNRRSPEPLFLADYEKVERASQDYCFARKFELGGSSDLMNILDRKDLNEQ